MTALYPCAHDAEFAIPNNHAMLFSLFWKASIEEELGRTVHDNAHVAFLEEPKIQR